MGESPVKLTLSEFQILCLLAKRPGWGFTRTPVNDQWSDSNSVPPSHSTRQPPM